MDRYCARSFMNKIYFVYNESLKINAQRVIEPGNVLSKPHLKRAPDVRLKLCICVSIFNLSLDNNNDLRYVINAVQHTMTINLILTYTVYIFYCTNIQLGLGCKLDRPLHVQSMVCTK